VKNKILITGAAGFVGSHLAPYLESKKYEVVVLVKNKKERLQLNIKGRVVVGDLSKKGKWQKEIHGVDVIVHLAAQISAKKASLFYKNNSVATKNLIAAAKKNNINNVILFSSAAVTSIRLDDYAKTKKDQEIFVRRSKMNYAIIRPSMIYGPGDTKNVGWLISILKKTPVVPLPGGGKFGRQPVYVKDICTIVEKIIKKGVSSEIYEIHGYEYITMEKMVKTILHKLKTRRLLINIPLTALYVAIRLNETLLSNPKFTTDQIKSLTTGERFKGDHWWKMFGIIPTKFEAGVEKMINE